MKFHTDVMGDVTTNIGIIKYDNKEAGRYGVNLRYPQDLNLKRLLKGLLMKLKTLI